MYIDGSTISKLIPHTTAFSYTDTAEGKVPHKTFFYQGYVCSAPVRILYDMRDTNHRPFPEHAKDGSYIFALPGGLRWANGRVEK